MSETNLTTREIAEQLVDPNRGAMQLTHLGWAELHSLARAYLDDTALPPVKVCTRCGAEAEWKEDEKLWRHKGAASDPLYFGQTFCDRYGYPIEVKDDMNSVVKDYLTTQCTDSIEERDAELSRLRAQSVILRKHIHAAERHNQFFERCESRWCNPIPTLACGGVASDPANEPHGDAYACRSLNEKESAELSRLRVENEALRKAVKREFIAQSEANAVEIADLRNDKARLDFLANAFPELSQADAADIVNGLKFKGKFYGDIRKAIDAALNAGEKKA